MCDKHKYETGEFSIFLKGCVCVLRKEIVFVYCCVLLCTEKRNQAQDGKEKNRLMERRGWLRAKKSAEYFKDDDDDRLL